MVEVTAAIICKRGRVLICQRPADKRCGLLWEFPGGKLEEGETGEQCIRRECREELTAELAEIRPFAEVVYEYPGYAVHIQFYTAKLAAGEPVRREHAAFRWIKPEEAAEIEFCPADAKMLSENRLSNLFPQ
ncbi:MAG: (deoxy)nucleoside triphosphate pyrophosphohydrolase [Oscillospiraceae bacterium]|jgi:8-oxo-dGTP diphosphatase|nr:(deoxy)nucleoside triphosphate pyrophosphohydrolase [Oscillospiraceae bacterium]